MAKEKQKQPEEYGQKNPSMVAKKDFVICHNDYFRRIQAGEDVSDVPSLFHENLETEGVI
jgi:hypothetical protein